VSNSRVRPGAQPAVPDLPTPPRAGLPPTDLSQNDVVIRRTPAGWRVEASNNHLPETIEDLSGAMVLADLLAGEFRPGPRPPRPAAPLDEADHLRVVVRQLEHALAARVLIEQAIGVLAERWQCQPREAFERLRAAARSRGRRVHDLAGEIVASVTDSTVSLPDDLSAPTT
jgi:ANTAR domain